MSKKESILGSIKKYGQRGIVFALLSLIYQAVSRLILGEGVITDPSKLTATSLGIAFVIALSVGVVIQGYLLSKAYESTE